MLLVAAGAHLVGLALASPPPFALLRPRFGKTKALALPTEAQASIWSNLAAPLCTTLAQALRVMVGAGSGHVFF